MACTQPSKFFPAMKTPALVQNAMKGKIALITGGGTGIGKAIATTFAALGADVVIAGRRLHVLEKTASEIQSKTGAQVVGMEMDVRKPETIVKVVDNIENKFGDIPSVVVNSAGDFVVMASERLSETVIRNNVDTDLFGTVNVTLEVGRRIIKNQEKSKGCAVLAISTAFARYGAPFAMPCAIAKAGVENFIKTMATEWAKYGMRFNVISPGPVITESAADQVSAMGLEGAMASPEKGIALGRCGEPEEIANLAAFVCSDYGSWLNGAIIDIDGGQQYTNHGSSFGARMHDMKSSDWERIENLMREGTGKTTP